jgi:hypothetical protein
MIIPLLLAVTMGIAMNVEVFAKSYTNTEYGIQTELPSGKVICTTENDGTTSDHGFTILWDTNLCPPEDNTPGIHVYFGMNAFESRSTFEEGKHICRGAVIRPSPFRVGGYQFYQCKPMRVGATVSLEYFVPRAVKGGSPEGESTYRVSLLCPRGDCRKLMPMTRWIFAHMRFIKQE